MKNQIIAVFNNSSLGYLKEQMLKQAFGISKSKLLIGKFTRLKLLLTKEVKQVSIIRFANSYAIRVLFTKCHFGSFPGCNWKVPFKYNSVNASISYSVFVPEDFDFVKGGKLPGLAGGKGNTGGLIPTGFDGWSVRFMFKENGTLCAYLYHADMKTEYGEKVFLRHENQVMVLKKGEWNSILLEIKMNDPDKNNGEVKCMLNKHSGLIINNLRFRKTENLGIDHFLFSCFMGGNDISYAPVSNQFLMFKDFVINYD
jgi:hypothetical protein